MQFVIHDYIYTCRGGARVFAAWGGGGKPHNGVGVLSTHFSDLETFPNEIQTLNYHNGVGYYHHGHDGPLRADKQKAHKQKNKTIPLQCDLLQLQAEFHRVEIESHTSFAWNSTRWICCDAIFPAFRLGPVYRGQFGEVLSWRGLMTDRPLSPDPTCLVGPPGEVPASVHTMGLPGKVPFAGESHGKRDPMWTRGLSDKWQVYKKIKSMGTTHSPNRLRSVESDQIAIESHSSAAGLRFF